MEALGRVFLASARRFPSRVAVQHQGRDSTYAEIEQRAVALAGWLRERGLQPGDRVGLLLPNSADYVSSYFGILLARGIVVALNPETTRRELARTLGHARPSAVIVEPRAPKILSQTASSLACIENVICAGPTTAEFPSAWKTAALDEVGAARPASPAPEPQLDDVAQIIYTSGTSGRPKGVALSHRNLAANTSSILEYLELQPSDSVFVILPFCYSYGNSLLLTHIAVGGRLVLASDFVFWNRALDLLERQRATGFAGVPSSFAMLLHKSDFAKRAFPDLRYLTCAGGGLAPATVDRIRAIAPHVKLFLMYGQTEAAARLSTLLPDEIEVRPGSIGRGIPGVTLAVLDDDGRPVAPGGVGEIVARGENVMVGYWNDPDQTHQVLRADGLHTGDLARVDEDGYVYVVGRRSDIIKSGAFRINPQAIEEVILELDGVAEVAVAGVPDEILGEVAVAFVVRSNGALPSQADILSHCLRTLPRHEMIKEVRFVDALPKTTSGKVKRAELRDRWTRSS